MRKKIKILAIIPCRSGSKGIKNKNIVNIFGKPLIYYTIFFARKCKFIDKVVVSTDSKKYQKISKKYGLEVNFLRPKKISKDDSLDISFFKHAINYLKKKENYKPNYVIHLRPTSPLRKIKDLKKMLSIFIKDKKADSIRSISYMKKNPYKCWEMNSKNVLKPIIKNNTTFKEPYNAPRQSLSNFYYQNGVYDILRTRILKKNLISGKKILGFFTKENVDIDNYNDLKNVEKFKKNFINFRKYIKN
jgi:CMP-N,N'-diacetyllegionaminic acid synthase